MNIGPDPSRKSTYSLPRSSQMRPPLPARRMTSAGMLPKLPPGSTRLASSMRSATGSRAVWMDILDSLETLETDLFGIEQLDEGAAEQAIVMGDDEIRSYDRRIVRRMGVGHECDAVVQRLGATAGRIAAHLGLHAGDDQSIDAGFAETAMQVGIVESAAVALLDDDLAGLRRHQGMMRPTSRALGQHMTRATIVLDVHDRYARGAGAFQQRGDPAHDLFAAMQRRRQGEHAPLDVDKHQGARHRLLDGHEDGMAHLAFDGAREMALAVCVLDQQHLARADDALLAVARLDRNGAVEIDDVLPARRGMPFIVVAAGRLAEEDG